MQEKAPLAGQRLFLFSCPKTGVQGKLCQVLIYNRRNFGYTFIITFDFEVTLC